MYQKSPGSDYHRHDATEHEREAKAGAKAPPFPRRAGRIIGRRGATGTGTLELAL